MTPKSKISVEGIKNIIVVASGKGGVGKSTIASLIAQNLSLTHRVGILDADIYGPSIPCIFGISQKPDLLNKKLIPLIAHHVQIMSIGFLTNDAMCAWRGPMVSKALFQLLSCTKWENLDYLIIDMPPGTGDIHLSLLENYVVDTVIMVTTPQKISQKAVAKSIDLYKKFNIPILGVIENMANIFEGNAAQDLCAYYNLKLLKSIPIIPELTTACDEAKPLVSVSTVDISQIIPSPIFK